VVRASVWIAHALAQTSVLGCACASSPHAAAAARSGPATKQTHLRNGFARLPNPLRLVDLLSASTAHSANPLGTRKVDGCANASLSLPACRHARPSLGARGWAHAWVLSPLVHAALHTFARTSYTLSPRRTPSLEG